MRGGISQCIVGYSGGEQPFPTYESMMDHTESLLIEYDPQRYSYLDILKKWRTLGVPYPAKTQYRWAVFYLNPQQEQIAKDFCRDIKYVDVEPATKFYMAEARHQDFLDRLG